MDKMRFDLQQQSYAGRWFRKSNYDGAWPYPEAVEFKIRPYPHSEATFTVEKEEEGQARATVEGREQLRRFIYCLEEIRGIVGADDKPLALQDGQGNDLPHAAQLKKMMFDFSFGLDAENGVPSISGFVLDITRSFDFRRIENLGNSQAGHAGITPRTTSQPAGAAGDPSNAEN